MLKNTPTYLLLISLFFYPFTFFSHTLYLFPQLFLIVAAIIRILNQRDSERVDSTRLFILITTFFLSLAFTLITEFYSDIPNYLLSSKIFVNCATVTLLYWSGIRFNIILIKKGVILIAILIFLISALSFLKANTSLFQIAILLTADEKLASSQLYGLALPLENIFITKNIAAMHIVSLFSIYLFCSMHTKCSVSILASILYFLTISLFFSRQALISFLVLLSVYSFISLGKYIKYIVLLILTFIFIFIFKSLFDLSSTADGAGERILLWQYFFKNISSFWILGNGLEGLNSLLYKHIGIDNFHMFFMNQIGAYGIFHFVTFTIFCLSSFGSFSNLKSTIFLIGGYYLNVTFQTYGYEYGNLILLSIALNTGSKKKLLSGKENGWDKIFSPARRLLRH
jgi:hypothetical protein